MDFITDTVPVYPKNLHYDYLFCKHWSDVIERSDILNLTALELHCFLPKTSLSKVRRGERLLTLPQAKEIARYFRQYFMTVGPLTTSNLINY